MKKLFPIILLVLITVPAFAAVQLGSGIFRSANIGTISEQDCLLLENGENLLLEDGTCILME